MGKKTNFTELLIADSLEAEFAYYQWQLIRRNPEYIVSYKRFERGEIEGKSLLEKFDFDPLFLIKPLDPSNDAQERQSIQYNIQVNTGGGKEYRLKPKEQEASLSQKNNPIFANLFKPAVMIVTPFLEDNKYITLKIDTTQKRNIISSKIKQVLDFVEISIKNKRTRRGRFKEWENQLKVWDLRSKKKPFNKIATELYPHENLSKSEDRVKKQYYLIYEKITGEKYDPQEFKELFRNKDLLPKTCKACKQRDTCTDPCPDILLYINSDYRSLRERLVGERHLEHISSNSDPEGIE